VGGAVTEENNFSLVRGRDAELVIRISGTWRLQDSLPSMDAVKKEIERFPHPRLALFDTQELRGWDSSVVWFLTKASELCRESGIAVDRGKLPKGLRRLVELAEAVPEKKGARREFVAMPFLERVGQSAIGAIASFTETLNFLGQISFTFLKLVKVRFRAVDLFLFIKQNGPPGTVYRHPHKLSGGHHSLLYWGRTTAAVRRPDLCCRSRRDRHSPRDGRHDDGNHHGRPHGLLLLRPSLAP
jgi:hypothetical protein